MSNVNTIDININVCLLKACSPANRAQALTYEKDTNKASQVCTVHRESDTEHFLWPHSYGRMRVTHARTHAIDRPTLA